MSRIGLTYISARLLYITKSSNVRFCIYKCPYFKRRRMDAADGEKSYRHKKIGGQNICDGKVEKCEKTCFKTAGVNGVLDIYWDIPKSSNFTTFWGMNGE